MRVGTDAVHPQHAVTLPSHHALRSPWGACTVPHKPVVLSYGDGMRVAAVVAVIGVHASGIGVMRYGRLDPLHWWSVLFHAFPQSTILDPQWMWVLGASSPLLTIR